MMEVDVRGEVRGKGIRYLSLYTTFATESIQLTHPAPPPTSITPKGTCTYL